MSFEIEKKRVFRLAEIHYGTAHQVHKAIEEMGELITAIARLNQKPNDPLLYEQVIEEVADVRNMVNQLAMIYGESLVAAKEQEKVARLRARIKVDASDGI